MPHQKSAVKKVSAETKLDDTSNPDDLQSFIEEASFVKDMTNTPGWSIIRRDIDRFKQEQIEKMAYLNPRRLEFQELRIQFLAGDKIIKMVEDYEENRKRSLALLHKLENTGSEIVLDYDNK